MKSPVHLSRRRFLFGAAGAAVAIPLLSSLQPRSSWASPMAPPPARLLVVYTPNGQFIDNWLPTGSETNFQLSPILAPLAAHRSKINIVHGAVGNYGHYMGHSECLTGRPRDDASFFPAGGPSLDQLIAKGMSGQVPLESLQLGVDTSDNATSIISYTKEGLPLPPQASARGAFERISGIVNLDPAEAERLRSQSRSVLDSVLADYDSLTPRLSNAERTLLDAHLELVREQEKRLQDPWRPVSCGQLPKNVSDLDMPTTFQAHLDTVAAAFACDITRVATLVVGGSGYTGQYGFIGVNQDFHQCAHGAVANSSDHLTTINAWHASMVDKLLARLDSIQEGGGTLLDNTIVFWTNELGLSKFEHSKSDTGLVIAGNAAGYFKTGRFVNLGGAHYHDVLLTLANAMGRTDVTKFGDSGTKILSALRG